MEQDFLGIDDYINILKRRKKLFFITFAIFFAIGTTVSLALPSIYLSEATILIEQQEIPSEFVRSTVTSYAGERIQIISHRVMTTDNLSKIIRDYGLYKKELETTSINNLAEKLRNDIELEMISASVVDPRSGRPTSATIAFKLSYSNEDPRIAQKVTNELVNLFLNENLKRRTQSASDTSAFLTAEAQKLSESISELEEKLASFKEEHINTLPELQQLNMRLMERTEKELADTKLQIRNLEERKVYLESEISQINPRTDLFNSQGKRVMGLEDSLKVKQTEYIALGTRYTEDHPTMVKLKDEISALKNELDTTNNNQIKTSDNSKIIEQSDNPNYVQLVTRLQATNAELTSARAMGEELQSKVNDYEKRLVQSPQVERLYLNLTRDYENAQNKYREVREKQLEAELAESLERESKGERFSLIEVPQLPESPDKPNRLALFFIGFIVSIAGGLGNVIVYEVLDQSVHGSKSLESITNTPPLAVIPFIKSTTDTLQRRRINTFSFAIVISLLVASIPIIHFFIKPLDVVWAVIARKVGF